MIIIKIVKLPGAIREYASNGETSVETMVEAAGFTIDENEKCEFNGSPVDPSYVPQSSGELIILKSIKGN
jgi:hypothetical protein